MTELKYFHLLGTCSKRAIQRTKGRWGRPYTYNPRSHLLGRLSEQTRQPIEVVREGLLEDRAELLRRKGITQ